MKLLFLATLTLFVAVCYSQTPTRPVIPETFQATVEIEIHTDETAFGSGVIARDQDKGWGVEDIWIVQNNVNVSQLRLERYDMGMVYLLRSTDRRCEVRKVNGSLPPYWKWVSCANYAGHVAIREYTYDSWSLPGPGGSFDLYVDPNMLNVPVYVNAEVGITTRNGHYRDFNAVTPSSTMFAIPKECQ